MAAPNITGPYPPSGCGPEGNTGRRGEQVPAEFANQQADSARAARIAELTARLAAIECRDQASGSTRVSGSDGPASTGVPARSLGDEPALSSGACRTATPPTGGGWATVPIGSSGTEGSTGRRRAEPGGHPEDAPGNPEAVAKAICLRLLTGAARPRAALETALRQRGIPDEVATVVLDRFVEVGLIDDRAYAEAFVAAKHRDRALGVTALRTELRRKGVDEVTVDAAVQLVDSDAERDRARALISRRVDAAMGNGAPTARRRLVGLLARRGYSAELSCQVVDEALAEYGAEQDAGWDN